MFVFINSFINNGHLCKPQFPYRNQTLVLHLECLQTFTIQFITATLKWVSFSLSSFVVWAMVKGQRFLWSMLPYSGKVQTCNGLKTCAINYMWHCWVRNFKSLVQCYQIFDHQPLWCLFLFWAIYLTQPVWEFDIETEWICLRSEGRAVIGTACSSRMVFRTGFEAVETQFGYLGRN